MSNLTVKGNASGTGTVILEAPNTNSNRTITLPDSTSTLATTADVAGVESMTLLGTLATTSGSSVTLSGLTLTSYKQLLCVWSGVSVSGASGKILLNSYFVGYASISAETQTGVGHLWIDLAGGVFSSNSGNTFYAIDNPIGQTNVGFAGVTTASTSITFTLSASTFDAGSIRIYGVK